MEFDSKEVQFYWRMYKSRKQGIPTHIFRQEYVKDIEMVESIDQIVSQKQESIKQAKDFVDQAKGLK